MKYETVLVLGGTGFLGKNLQKVKPEWIYVGRSSFIENSVICEGPNPPDDFTNYDSIYDIINGFNPDAVINLAADVGGIQYNEQNQLSIYENNILMNTNIIKACRELEIDRVLSCLSTCAWPDMEDFSYPTDEQTFFGSYYESIGNGNFWNLEVHPFKGHLGYGYSKRMLHLHSQLARRAGYNYSTFAPSNLYGPFDHMGEKNEHFVAALVNKVSKLEGNETLRLLGDGTPRRQFLFAPDLAQIIPILLEEHNTDVPLIVSPDECLSINEMATKALEVVDKHVSIQYSGQNNGQRKKEHSNQELKKLIGNFEFTSFKDGFKQTYEWYRENRIAS